MCYDTKFFFKTRKHFPTWNFKLNSRWFCNRFRAANANKLTLKSTILDVISLNKIAWLNPDPYSRRRKEDKIYSKIPEYLSRKSYFKIDISTFKTIKKLITFRAESTNVRILHLKLSVSVIDICVHVQKTECSKVLDLYFKSIMISYYKTSLFSQKHTLYVLGGFKCISSS